MVGHLRLDPAGRPSVGALRAGGFNAPAAIDGAMDGPAFLAHIGQAPAPALGAGDVLVADSLSVHKVAGAKETVEARGATILRLPPYPPDRTRLQQAEALAALGR